MGCGDKGSRIVVPGLTDFVGEEFVIPVQWYCLQCHGLGPILGR